MEYQDLIEDGFAAISDTWPVLDNLVEDSAELENDPTGTRTCPYLVEDGLSFELRFIMDGEEWECWVLNSNLINVSVYSNFDFNSFCEYEDNCFAADETGVHLLDGDTDGGSQFKTGIVLPPTTFDMAQFKRFRKAYLGYMNGSPVIRAETDNGYKDYRVIHSEVTLRRDQKGKKWTFLLEDFGELSFIELIPIVLAR